MDFGGAGELSVLQSREMQTAAQARLLLRAGTVGRPVGLSPPRALRIRSMRASAGGSALMPLSNAYPWAKHARSGGTQHSSMIVLR